jgi:threonine dehydratase
VLQPTARSGAGALAALGNPPRPSAESGVVTASAGNHGLGVAFAASRLGVARHRRCTGDRSSAKVAALRECPIDLVQHGDDYAAAERHALVIVTKCDVRVAYNDTHVIAGNGSVLAEVRDDLAGPLTVVVPVAAAA